MCIRFGKQITYTPKQTSEYEKLIKASYIAVSRTFFEKGVSLEINILAFYGEAPQQIRTKDVCKNKSEIARNEKYWATKSPMRTTL